MKLQMLARQYPNMIGLARYVSALQAALTQIGLDYETVAPAYPLLVRLGDRLLRPLRFDVNTFITNYPVSARLERGAVKHLTNQLMGSLLTFQPGMDRVVITVHDIVPYLMRFDPVHNELPHFYDRWVDQFAMHNLKRADRLIAISGYTKKMLVEQLGCSDENIRVILYGLDHELFKLVDISAEFLQNYNLSKDDYHYLLYVGSELPRKNLPRLLQALAKVKLEIPNVRLLKIGTPIFASHFEALRTLIVELGLQDNVQFIDHPPQLDLVKFYNFTDVFVFPSLFEGFGMPPLEAMACGAPVISSNAGPLPEVVGEAAIKIDPYDVDAWAREIVRVLMDDTLRANLSKGGLKHAEQFTWEKHARQTLSVYQELE